MAVNNNNNISTSYKVTTNLGINEGIKAFGQFISEIDWPDTDEVNIVLRKSNTYSLGNSNEPIFPVINPKVFERYTFNKDLEEMFTKAALREKLLLLSGAVSSGKTVWTEYLAYKLTNGAVTSDRIQILRFWHYRYAYFMYRRSVNNGILEIKRGPFLELCNRASADPDNNYVLILDDINRCDVADVLSDFTKMIKTRNNPIKTQYGGTATMPDNLIVLATMCEFDVTTWKLPPELRNMFPEYEITGDDVDITKLLNTDDTDVIKKADKIRRITLSVNKFIRSNYKNVAYSIGPRAFGGNIETIFDLQCMVEGRILSHLQDALKEDYRNEAIAAEINALENFVNTGSLEV